MSTWEFSKVPSPPLCCDPPRFHGRAATPELVRSLVERGLTFSDYEYLERLRACYGFSSIASLLRDALERAEVRP